MTRPFPPYSFLSSAAALFRLAAGIVCLNFLATVDGQNLTLGAKFSETMINLFWEQDPQAPAYNVYADFGKGFVLANPVPVTTRTQFCFIWANEKGMKKRVVKGHTVELYVRALNGARCGRPGGECIESKAQSNRVRTDYFRGFTQVASDTACARILGAARESVSVLGDAKGISRQDFLARYPPLAAAICAVYHANVDPLDEGACVPFSTIVCKYFTARGIPCYRCQGLFVEQFHSFNIVKVDSVEYILDFTADQFLPSSAPVLIPRSACFIDSTGAPTATPRGTFTAMYLPEKVFSADRVFFSQTPQAMRYQAILDSLLSH